MPSTAARAYAQALAKDVAEDLVGSPPRRWYYMQDGIRYGPLTGPEIRASARLGFIGGHDLVRCGEDARWVRAVAVPGLFAGPDATPAN